MPQHQPSENSSDSATAEPSPCPPSGSASTTPPAASTSPSTSPTTARSKSGPSSTLPSPNQETTIPIDAVDTADANNGRFAPDPDRVRDYAMSIAANGLLNPITVRNKGNRYELLAGLHRLSACKTLGHTHIRATIVQADDVRAQTIRLAENTARSNLSPVEEARQLHYLVEASAQGVEAIAAAIGRRTEWILDRLELISWPEALLDAIHMKTISLAAAKRLVRIHPDDLRDQRIRDAVHHGINARTAALWLQDSQNTAISQNESPEFSSFQGAPEYETDTRAICALCKTPTPLESVQRVLICATCHSAVENAFTPTTPETQRPAAPPHPETANPPLDGPDTSRTQRTLPTGDRQITPRPCHHEIPQPTPPPASESP